MDQGLSGMGSVKVAQKAHVPSHSPVQGARGIYYKPQQMTAQDRAISAANTVQNTFSIPLFYGFLMSLPMAAAGWVAKKAGRINAQTWLSGGADALAQQPRTTTIAKGFHLPADMLDRVANKASEVGARDIEQTLIARSGRWHANAQVVQSGLGKVVAPIVSVGSSALKAVNLHGPVKKSLTYIGGKPIGAAFAAVAAVGGIAAVWLTRSKQSKEHAQAVADMKAAFGAEHPLVAQSSKIYSKEKTNSMVSSALDSVNQALFVAFEAFPSVGGPAFIGLMAGPMVLQAGQQMFVTENPVADAFVSLKKVAEGSLQAPQQQQAFWISQLIMANPAAQGKKDSRQASVLMANELLANKASFEEIVATLREPAKFEALAKTVVEKQNAAKAAQPSQSTAAHPVMHGAAPAAKVTGSVHQGQGLHSAAKTASVPTQHASHTARVEAASPELAHIAR